ncbi:MAG: hypothetical protein E4H14_06625 [Candidatus Thorarchaeota archaeon]|nr:MAG: hypothetical protein E4H14_06625 [Candidatus Thorarchaeota archaeon]
MIPMFLEEREALNERFEFSAVVFDELFASEAEPQGDEMVVQMDEEKWNKYVQELIAKGRHDVAAENMIYCLKANPANEENWKLLVDLLEAINDPKMMEIAKTALQSFTAGEPIDNRTWRGLYVSPPK